MAVPSEVGDLDYTSTQLRTPIEWVYETVDITSQADLDLKLDSDGNPNLAYYPPGEVRFAIRKNESWASQLIATTPFGGGSVCLAVSVEGVPHIFYTLDGFQHRWLSGASWQQERVEFEPGTIDRRCDAAFDESGRLHVAWASRKLSYPQGDVKYAFRDGGIWKVEKIDIAGRGSTWASIAIDAKSRPHISYYEDVRGEVRHALRAPTGNWTIEVVDQVGSILAVGRQGSLALDRLGFSHIAYSYRVNATSQHIRYASQQGIGAWLFEEVEEGRGLYPSLATSIDTSHLVYRRTTFVDPATGSSEAEIVYAVRGVKLWDREIVARGFFDGVNRTGGLPTYPALVLDRCFNPHISYYDSGVPGVVYAAKGEPCPPEGEPIVSLDVDPDTLNLKSKGRWITAYLSAEKASIYDIDISSILLQDMLVPERYDYQDEVLMLKFNRQGFKKTVVVGESVEVKITGKWKDGSDFEAFDYIQVINPGKHQAGS